jgi:hypothetical protein
MRAVHDDLEQSTIYLAVFPSDSSQKQYIEQLQTLARQTDTLAQLTASAGVGQLRSSINRLFEQVPRAFNFARANRTARRDSIIDLVISPALLAVDRVLSSQGTAMEQRTAEQVKDFAVRTEDAAVLALGALGMAILIAFGVAIWLTRSISSPLKNSMPACAPWPKDTCAGRSRSAPTAVTSSVGWPEFPVDGGAARGTRPAEGGIRVHRHTRAQDARQRHAWLPPVAAGKRVRGTERPATRDRRHHGVADAATFPAHPPAAGREPLRRRWRQA